MRVKATTKGHLKEWFGAFWSLDTSEEQAALELFGSWDLYTHLPLSCSRADLFWWIMDFYWGPDSAKPFIRHPWAERMTEEACRHQYLAVSGAASSGKSRWAAAWSISNWISRPFETKVFITSTSKTDSKNRIWGDIREMYQGSKYPLPGRYIHSLLTIRASEESSGTEASDKAGIELVAASQSKDAQAVGKLIGKKSDHRMLFIADELPELGESILNACYSNLSVNPRFQLVGLGNHKSWLDPFGQFATPKAGIKAVTVEDEGWFTERGYCLHLDGPKSPNFLEDKDKWPIYGRHHKTQHDKLKPNSIGFWRMCRSFPAPDADADRIYSEVEIITCGALEKIRFRGPAITLSGLDPSFTAGGDGCLGVSGSLGMTEDNRLVLAYKAHERFEVDILKTKEVAPNFQMARQYIAWCKEQNIEPSNAGTDVTSGGAPFADIIFQEWSNRLLRVQFSGAASDANISPTDPKAANEEYANRVSELWGIGVHYIRGGQFANLPGQLVSQMCSRKYDTEKRGSSALMKVESKEEMRKRGPSPDLADAWFVLLEVARQRHGFYPIAFGKPMLQEEAEDDQWKRLNARDVNEYNGITVDWDISVEAFA